MKKGICNVSVAPIRAENADSSEMVTQMLYGETADIVEVKNNFTKIRMHYDGYEGWMDTKQITILEDDTKQEQGYITDAFQITEIDQQPTLLSFGSVVPNNTTTSVDKNNTRQSIVAHAKKFLNVPYLWGGKSYFGIDCSGFTQMVYKVHDIAILRDASQQAESGDVLNFLEEAQPGDLAFFDNQEGKITHVGIILEGQKIIHAHGKVRIDDLDSMGIFNQDFKKHTHKLRFIKSYI